VCAFVCGPVSEVNCDGPVLPNAPLLMNMVLGSVAIRCAIVVGLPSFEYGTKVLCHLHINMYTRNCAYFDTHTQTNAHAI
jgi:hypothetical protein